MSNKLTTSMRTLRDGILDIEAELTNRVRGLLLAAKFALEGIVMRAFDGVFGMGIGLSDNAFMLLRQVTVTVLGERTDPLNVLIIRSAVDYDAGFTDGRLGMVPAPRTKRAAKK